MTRVQVQLTRAGRKEWPRRKDDWFTVIRWWRGCMTVKATGHKGTERWNPEWFDWARVRISQEGKAAND